MRRASETVEIRRDRSPARVVREEVRREVPVETVIVEERRETRRERSRGGSEYSNRTKLFRGRRIADLQFENPGDEVVVIEEHSPPRRSKSKRESGFRTVDSRAIAGVVGGRKASRRDSGR